MMIRSCAESERAYTGFFRRRASPVRNAFPSARIFFAITWVISLFSCGGDSAGPGVHASKSVTGVPFAGPLSGSSPVAGSLSVGVPTSGSLSVSSPTPSVNASSVTSVNAPSMRLLWQNTSTGDRSIWLMSGTSWNGSYAALPQVPTAWSIAGSADFNGDGNADIVWQNTTTGHRSIWFMSCTAWNGTYSLLPQISTQWSIAGAGGFNGDGKPDLGWQNTLTGGRSI